MSGSITTNNGVIYQTFAKDRNPVIEQDTSLESAIQVGHLAAVYHNFPPQIIIRTLPEEVTELENALSFFFFFFYLVVHKMRRM